LFHQAANDSEAAPQVLGITSSLTGEGKTTTALWLARLLAASGGRVLLVDADLRRPSLQSLLNLRVDASVADALLGRVTLDSLILQDPRVPELSILCGDPPAQSNDIEMLTPQLIENAFIALRRDYTHIIVDAPPVLPVSEAQLFLKAVDQCLFLVRWDHTPMDIVRTTLQQLTAGGIRVVGYAISRVKLKAHALYRYADAGTYFQHARSSSNSLKRSA